MATRTHKAAEIVLLLLILMTCFLYLLRPISDADFFWHLKTGEWIWSHRELPGDDPFSYTSAATENMRKHFILTSYWLSQLTYYLFYRIAGKRLQLEPLIGCL